MRHVTAAMPHSQEWEATAWFRKFYLVKYCGAIFIAGDRFSRAGKRTPRGTNGQAFRWQGPRRNRLSEKRFAQTIPAIPLLTIEAETETKKQNLCEIPACFKLTAWNGFKRNFRLKRARAAFT